MMMMMGVIILMRVYFGSGSWELRPLRRVILPLMIFYERSVSKTKLV